MEARLDARFAALEANFAAFEVRAQNGFGRFSESGDDASNEAQGSNLVVSTPQRPVDNSNVINQVVLTQHARAGEMIGADLSDRRMARKEAKPKQEKVRKTGKRDGHKGRQRSRR